MIEVVLIGPLTLPFGEDHESTIDVGRVCCGIEVVEVTDQILGGNRECSLSISREHEWLSSFSLFMEVIIPISI